MKSSKQTFNQWNFILLKNIHSIHIQTWKNIDKYWCKYCGLKDVKLTFCVMSCENLILCRDWREKRMFCNLPKSYASLIFTAKLNYYKMTFIRSTSFVVIFNYTYWRHKYHVIFFLWFSIQFSNVYIIFRSFSFFFIFFFFSSKMKIFLHIFYVSN
jgi:hypothetical protein